MKELSIEEKAKAYDEAIEKFDVILNLDIVKESGTIFADDVRKILPELKESEDERIRKLLLYHFGNKTKKEWNGIPVKDILAWLEKQGDANKEYWRGYREGKQEILDKYAELEKQGESYTKRDVDDAYLKGISDAKNEIEKQYEANYQIRKDIATFIFNYRGDIKDRAKWMDYLGIKVSFVEKQGEQKLPIEKLPSEMKTIGESLGFTTQEECDKYGQMVTDLIMSEPTDKVEPKFHKGDWVVSPNGVYWHIDAIQDGRYQVSSDSGKCAEWPLDTNIYHRFNIQDAKDGDVIVTENKNIFIFKSISGYTIYDYCGLYFGKFCNSSGTVNGSTAKQLPTEYVPATKEQRDTLFKAMADAGYTFDFEKKELKKIEQKPTTINIDKMVDDYANNKERGNEEFGKPVNCMIKAYRQGLIDAIGKVVLKPAWSEEDEKVIHYLEYTVKHFYEDEDTIKLCCDWLKSLRPQNKYAYNPYKAVVESIAEMCKHYDKASHSGLKDFYDNVKAKCKDAKEYDSLYPQSQWKPSDEQIKALETTLYTNMSRNDGRYSVLSEFVKELKKLK